MDGFIWLRDGALAVNPAHIISVAIGTYAGAESATITTDAGHGLPVRTIEVRGEDIATVRAALTDAEAWELRP